MAPWLEEPRDDLVLVPTLEFRREAPGNRFADPARRRANWGAADHGQAFELRLARDDLWDAEVIRRANAGPARSGVILVVGSSVENKS